MHHSSTKRSASSLRRNANPTFVAIAALALLASPAQATSRGMQVSKQGASPRQICHDVMRLSPGEALYEGCVASLEEFRRSAAADPAGGLSPGACFAGRASRGNADIKMCEAPGTSVSFYAASFDTKIDRERRACALLGLAPRGVAFTRCVSNLQDSVDTAGEPDGE